MSTRELISSAGGQLGLCAGVSFGSGSLVLLHGFESAAFRRKQQKIFMFKKFLSDPNCQSSLMTEIHINNENDEQEIENVFIIALLIVKCCSSAGDKLNYFHGVNYCQTRLT